MPNNKGFYASKVFDAGREASWNSIRWSEGLPYGEENSAQEKIRGLWHFNEKEWTGEKDEVLDSSKNDFHLSRQGNAQISKDAIFTRSGFFDGHGSYLSREYEEALHPERWSISAWINQEILTTLKQ